MEIELTLPPAFYEMLNRLEAFDQKLDRLVEMFAEALANMVEAPPESEPEPPQPEQPKAKRKASKIPGVEHVRLENVRLVGIEPRPTNGEDEDALRARVAFESKRVQRMLGVGAMRAAIKRVAGHGVLQIDDVPPQQLGELLTALQAL
jgi:hypothetical protein